MHAVLTINQHERGYTATIRRRTAKQFGLPMRR